MVKTEIFLKREYFSETATSFLQNDEFKVNLFRYPSGVEAIELTNSRGKIVVLPYMG